MVKYQPAMLKVLGSSPSFAMFLPKYFFDKKTCLKNMAKGGLELRTLSIAVQHFTTEPLRFDEDCGLWVWYYYAYTTIALATLADFVSAIGSPCSCYTVCIVHSSGFLWLRAAICAAADGNYWGWWGHGDSMDLFLGDLASALICGLLISWLMVNQTNS